MLRTKISILKWWSWWAWSYHNPLSGWWWWRRSWSWHTNPLPTLWWWERRPWSSHTNNTEDHDENYDRDRHEHVNTSAGVCEAVPTVSFLFWGKTRFEQFFMYNWTFDQKAYSIWSRKVLHFCTKGICKFICLIFCTLEHKDVALLKFSAKSFWILELLSRKLLYSLHLFIFLKSPTVDLTVTEQLPPFVSTAGALVVITV